VDGGKALKTENKVIALSITFGLFVWVVDAVLDYFIFYEGTFWGLLISDVPKHEVYIRLVILGSFIIFGIIISGHLARRKQAEEKTKASEVRFRELFNNMSSGVAVYEAKDNGNDFIFKNISRAAERIEKIKKEDLIGKSVLEIFPGVKELGLFDVFKRPLNFS